MPDNGVVGVRLNPKRSHATRVLLLAVFLCTLTGSLDAQRRGRKPPPEVGLRGGYEFRSKDFSAGAQMRIPLARGSDLIPSGDWFFRSGTNFQLNLDLALPLMPGGGFYAGGGLGVAFTDRSASSGLDTTIGGNLFVGVAPYKSQKQGLRWFFEVRSFLRSGTNPLMVVVGLNTPLGG